MNLYLQLNNFGKLPYHEIDPKIRNLVAVLQYMGLEPDSSCEGHLDRNEHRHPQVGFELDPSDSKLNELDRLLTVYNRAGKIMWWRNQNRPTGKLMPQTYSEMCSRCYGSDQSIPATQDKLSELQVSAEELAVFLFEILSIPS